MSFAARSYQKELLDEDDIPFEDIRQNMHELNTINTLLGGHAITCKGVDYFIKKYSVQSALTIAEIGCGGGDNLAAVHRYLQAKKMPHRLLGIDIKSECIRSAAANVHVAAEWMCSDYKLVRWTQKPDIIFSSLFCHHFTNAELAEQLRWLKENSRLGFFINDLQRHPAAYYSIKLLTHFFSKSYLVKHDAPLSVKRGFTKNDWRRILQEASISNFMLRWQWAFRYLLCIGNE